MAVVEMTLAEALVRKKTYEAKIENMTQELTIDTTRTTRRFAFCDYIVGTKKVGSISNSSEEEFTQSTIASLDSVSHLISNYERLCMAINKKNNETIVNIAGRDMTIVEAIALKNGLLKTFRLAVAKKLMADYQTVQKQIDRINSQVNDPDKINSYLDSVLTEETKKDPDAVKKAEETYHLMRDARMIDPINVTETYDKIVQSEQSFRDEVDFRLSEINAKTIIEVEFDD